MNSNKAFNAASTPPIRYDSCYGAL